MTLKDPGPEVRSQPSPYPKATQGVGFVREADEAGADLEAAADDGAHELVEIEAVETPLGEATEFVELAPGLDGEGSAAQAEDEADRHDVFEAHEVIETEAAPVEAGEADDEALTEEEPAWTSSPN
jgi:hypothetical protein